MKAYLRKKDYCLVLDRCKGEIDILSKIELGAELFDYETQKTTSKHIKLKLGYAEGNNLVSLITSKKIDYVTISNQLFTGFLQNGILSYSYDMNNKIYITDGIMPQGIGWPNPKLMD